MRYFCNFKTIKADTESQDHFGAACFGDIYRNGKNYKKVVFYVCKDYKDYSHNKMNFSEKQVLEYVEGLKSLGFTLDVNTQDSFTYISKKYEAYSFTIPLKENYFLGVLFLLNCLRYLHEDNYPTILEKLFKWWNDEDRSNFYNKLIIAHYQQEYSCGHCFKPSYSKLLDLVEDAQVLQMIEQNKDSNSVSGSLRQIKKLPSGLDLGELKSLINQNNSFKEILEKYTKLCEKYL